MERMAGIILKLVGIVCFPSLVSAHLPARTMQAHEHYLPPVGWTPIPTETPSLQRLLRRYDTLPGSICGFVTSDARKSGSLQVK